MVLTILRSVNYYTQEELTELSSRMKVLNTYQEQERMKLRADEYFINDNYLAAIYEYEKILDIRQSDPGWAWNFMPMSGIIWASAIAAFSSSVGLRRRSALPGSTRRIRRS